MLWYMDTNPLSWLSPTRGAIERFLFVRSHEKL